MALATFATRPRSLRLLILGAFAAAAVLVSGGIGIRASHANSSNSGVFVLRNKATGFALDSNGNRQVYALPQNGGAYQKWVFQSKGNGYYTLLNDATGFALDSNGDGQAYALPSNGGSYQQWKVTSLGNGYYSLRNKATGFMLDSNGDRQVYTLSSNGGSYQQWRLIATEE